MTPTQTPAAQPDRYDWTAVQSAFVERFGAAEVVYQLYITLWMASTKERQRAEALLALSRRLLEAWGEYQAATEGANAPEEPPCAG